ncbi:MAG: hypothetical protein ACI90V_000390 [Bacillariaceae sp.]|jgi:hypothetical protein
MHTVVYTWVAAVFITYLKLEVLNLRLIVRSSNVHHPKKSIQLAINFNHDRGLASNSSIHHPHQSADGISFFFN